MVVMVMSAQHLYGVHGLTIKQFATSLIEFGCIIAFGS